MSLVKEAFTEVVEKILDTPELWSSTNAGKDRVPAGTNGMPGGNANVDLTKRSDDQASGGCSC